MSNLIRAPKVGDEQLRYTVRAREQRSFHTVLSAHEMLDPKGERTMEVRSACGDDALRLDFEFPLARGTIHETLTFSTKGGRLKSRSLVRTVFDSSKARVRHEEIMFGGDTLPLPEHTYPEVALPFLLRWQPFDGRIRDLYAWINDRFVARVEYQSTGRERLQLPDKQREAIKVIMYPDFNDWVRLGKVLSKLARPFAPKYHMWYAPDPPHTVLRFEGPWGPPGAPELVMELAEG